MTYTILLQDKPGYCAGDLNACAYPITTAIHVAKDGEQRRWFSCDVHAKLRVYARFRAVIKFEALTAADVEQLVAWGLTAKEVPMPTRVAWGRRAKGGAEIHVVSSKIPAECSCGWRLYKETREQAIAAVERHLAKAVEVDFQPRQYNAEKRQWEEAGPAIKVYDCVGSVGREAEHEEHLQAEGRVRPALNKVKPTPKDNIELPARSRNDSWWALCGTCDEAVRMVSGKYQNLGYLVLEGHWLQKRHEDIGIGYAGDRCPGAFKRARKPTKEEKAAWKAAAAKAKADQEAAFAKMREVVKARAWGDEEGLCTCEQPGEPQRMQESAKVTRYICSTCGGYFDRISERAIASYEVLRDEARADD